VPIDLVYLDLRGTVVELISYEGASIDPAPEKEHLGYRMTALEVERCKLRSPLPDAPSRSPAPERRERAA
jgi:hypothetical protein